MGNWQLEVGKMAVYIFLPVGAFYLFHQVDYFRDELLRIERRSRTKSSFENEEKMERLMQKIREKREEDFRTNLSNLASESKE